MPLLPPNLRNPWGPNVGAQGFRPPLAPSGGMVFNPFSQLDPAQVQDLRHSPAFRRFLRERAIGPADWLAYRAATGRFWAQHQLRQNPALPDPPYGVPMNPRAAQAVWPQNYPRPPRFPY